MRRPVSLILYSVFIWITKLLLIFGNLYFIKYVADHRDFYLGIGLYDTTIQQYILLAGSLIVLVGTVRIFQMKKNGWKIYLGGKLLEAIALFWAYPSYTGAFTHALHGINTNAFDIVFLLILICLTTIFPLVYYTYSPKLR